MTQNLEIKDKNLSSQSFLTLEHKLTENQITAIKLVSSLANVYNQDRTKSEEALLYLKLHGYVENSNSRSLKLSKKEVSEDLSGLLNYSEKNRKFIDKLLKKLSNDIRKDPNLAEILLLGDFSCLTESYSRLGVKNIKLLEDIFKHQIEINSLNLEILDARFPFSVREEKYFKHFLFSHPESPQNGFRHLVSSAAFFSITHSLIEFLKSPYSPIAIVRLAPENNRSSDDENTLFDCLHVCIERFSHQVDSLYDLDKRKLTVLEIPEFPSINFPYHAERFNNSLMREFADWFVHGKEDGKELNFQIPVEEKIRNRKEKGSGDTFYELSIMEHIREHDYYLDQMNSFRNNLTKATENSANIVFSYKSYATNHSSSIDLVLKMLYKITSIKNHSPGSGLDILSKGSFLLNGQAGVLLHKASANSNSFNKKPRIFFVPKDEVTPSVLNVLAPFLPKDNGSREKSFANNIVKILDIPGYSKDYNSPLKFTSDLKLAKGTNFNIEKTLEYALEKTPYMGLEEFLSVLVSYYESGGDTLNNRTKWLCTNKFGIAKEVIDKFETYGKYKPKKIGVLPSIFEDIANFERYREKGINALGVSKESKKLEELLVKNNVVVIVDGTSYHPEYSSEVNGSKVSNDVENTGEKWGSYVRPGLRVVDRFVKDIVERNTDKFKDWSVITVKEPNKDDKALAAFFKAFLGIEIGTKVDLSQINQHFSKVHTYNDKSIVVINAESLTELKQLSSLLEILDEYKFKVIVRAREAIPGFSQVQITPWTDSQVNERIKSEKEIISREFGLTKPITDEVIDLVTTQVRQFRGPEGDPLNFNLVVLHTAATRAKAHKSTEIIPQDISTALASVFHLPDPDKTNLAVSAIQDFANKAPLEILGQKEAINKVTDSVIAHISGTRDPSRPLTLFIPGPTGVGKTELALHIALAAGLPFKLIEGSRFVEGHSLASLLGSPSGYVGPDEGILYKFVESNSSGVVFIDEIEKMHPEVFQGLMNFFDRGQLTAGNGKTITRPGFIVIAASNAGADKLNRNMSPEEIRDILGRELSAVEGKSRPELVARWDVVPMLALEREDFDKVLAKSLNSLSNRYGFIQANLKLVGVDSVAIDMLFEASKDVCRASEREIKLGFSKNGEASKIPPELYQDMRYVSRAFSNLSQESISKAVRAEHLSGRPSERVPPREVKLLGDRKNSRIILVDAETGEELG